MPSGSGSMGSSNFHPDTTADQIFSLSDFLAVEKALLREILENPFPEPSGGFHHNFPYGIQQDTTPSPAARQHGFPSPSDVPGPSSFPPPVAKTLFDSNRRNPDARRKGLTGARSRVTRDTRSDIDVPAIPPTPSLPFATTFPAHWAVVPQKEYNYGRKQWSFKPHDPVSFSERGRPGVNMGAALRKKLENLDGLDDPVLQEASGAISCRFLFHGYPANGGVFQIHALNWTRKRLPIKRGKLAHEIARRLERYLHNMAKFTLDKSVEDRWAIGQGCMHIDNMFLVRLVSVSKGSFQPEIWVADPLMSHLP